MSQQRETEQTLGDASREDKAALEQSRDLVLSFKSKLQQNDELFKAKDDEIQNLREKIEKLTVESAAQNVQITELYEEIKEMGTDNDGKSNEVTRALQ